jgi:hypothetical protein
VTKDTSGKQRYQAETVGVDALSVQERKDGKREDILKKKVKGKQQVKPYHPK